MMAEIIRDYIRGKYNQDSLPSDVHDIFSRIQDEVSDLEVVVNRMEPQTEWASEVILDLQAKIQGLKVHLEEMAGTVGEI